MAEAIVLFWLLEEEEKEQERAQEEVKLINLNIKYLLKQSKCITRVQIVPYANKYYCGFYINDDSKPIIIRLRKQEFEKFIVILKLPNNKLHFQEYKEPDCQCIIL